jgi:PhnB protein
MAQMKLSFMLSVPDAGEASRWYRIALGAVEQWSLGTVRGLELGDTLFILHQPTDKMKSPLEVGTTTVRIELFTDDIVSVVARALEAGAAGSIDNVRDHEMPWGTRKAGGFQDPFGHSWIVGDLAPLTWRGDFGRGS